MTGGSLTVCNATLRLSVGSKQDYSPRRKHDIGSFPGLNAANIKLRTEIFDHKVGIQGDGGRSMWLRRTLRARLTALEYFPSGQVNYMVVRQLH